MPKNACSAATTKNDVIVTPMNKISLGLSPGAGLLQTSALLINKIEPVDHNSMKPNRIIEARSPLAKR